MSDVTRADVERLVYGEVEDPAELRRILDHLESHPDGEAARFLKEAQRRSETALDVHWGRLVDVTEPRHPVERAQKDQVTEFRAQIVQLNRESKELQEQGAYEQALEAGKQAATLSRQQLGDDDPLRAKILNNLAATYRLVGKYKEAESLYREALEVAQKGLGDAHLLAGKILNNLGYALFKLCAYAEAEGLYRKALEVRRAVVGAAHPDVAQTLNNLGALYKEIGDYPAARSHYEGALQIRETAANCATASDLRPAKRELATCVGNLAALSQAEGDYREAERLCRRALELDREALGQEHPDYAIDLNNLGIALKAMGNYAEAERLYRAALELKRKALPSGHPSIATAISNLAALRGAMSDYGGAEELYREALAILQRALGEHHGDVATSLNNVAATLKKRGDYLQADELYGRSLTIRRTLFGERHPAVAQSLNNLALLYQEMGEFAKAQQYAEQALATSRDVLGEGHPDTAQARNTLGHLLRARGEYAAAETLYQEALETKRKTLGERHPSVAATLHNLAVLYAATGRQAEAAALMKTVAEIEDEMINQVFSVASEQQRKTYVEGIRGRLDAFLSLVLRYFPHEPKWACVALDLVLRRKALEAEPAGAQWHAGVLAVASGEDHDLAEDLGSRQPVRAGCRPRARLLLSRPVYGSSAFDGRGESARRLLAGGRPARDGRGVEVPFPSVRIGVAERADSPTGCTVFHFPHRAFAVADVRGGASATVCSDRLAEGGTIDAICLAGGSVFGLQAAAGVAAELFAAAERSPRWDTLPIVAGAVIYDFGRREGATYPDLALGAAALRRAAPGWFPHGPRGAGRSASVGKWLPPPYRAEPSGQGGAVWQSGEAAIGVFTVVNAMGGVLDRAGAVVRGHLDPATQRRHRVSDVLPSATPGSAPRGGNTTLTVLITNVVMEGDRLRHLARQVHTSMARAIDPFCTAWDGDVLYAVTLNEVRTAELGPDHLAVVASELAWDAVLDSCTAAEAGAGECRGEQETRGRDG
jgi:tetratricopeptide (TPR) repeat protein/L-aminopeptidase/D-esterase-like protein